MSSHTIPTHDLSSRELASWLDRQADTSWWGVHGDPFLASRLTFPCSSNELADEIRRSTRGLVVYDPSGGELPAGGTATADNLDAFVEHAELGTRVLQLAWKESNGYWLLVEDEETSESVGRERAARYDS